LNGKLEGWDGFDLYKVRNYFGTSHPHKNLDVITFTNQGNDKYKQYNWVFSGNELTLTEFVRDGDDMILGKEKIILKKK